MKVCKGNSWEEAVRLTLTSKLAISTLKQSAKASSPLFETLYAPMFRQLKKAKMLDTKIIRPVEASGEETLVFIHMETKDVMSGGCVCDFSPLAARTKGRKAMVVLMQPNRLTSTMVWKSSIVLHSISAQSEIPALLTRPHRPERV